MGQNVAAGGGLDAHLDHRQTPAELENSGLSDERLHIRLAQEIDVEVGGHGKRHRPDMGEDDGIRRQIGERKQRRPRNRAAGPDMRAATWPLPVKWPERCNSGRAR